MANCECHNQRVNLHVPMVFLWVSYGFPMVFHGQMCPGMFLKLVGQSQGWWFFSSIHGDLPSTSHDESQIPYCWLHKYTSMHIFIYICMYVYVNMYIVIYLSSYLCIFSSYIYKYCIHINIVYIHMHINDIHHNIPMMYPHLRMIALMDPSNVSSLSMVPFINPGNITLSKPYIICWPSPTRWNYYFLFLYGITITIYIVICPVICCVDLYMLFHLGQTPWTPGRKKNNNHIFTIYY